MYTDSDLQAITRHLENLPTRLALHQIMHVYMPLGLEISFSLHPLLPGGVKLEVTNIINKQTICAISGHEPEGAMYASNYLVTTCKVCGRVLPDQFRTLYAPELYVQTLVAQ